MKANVIASIGALALLVAGCATPPATPTSTATAKIEATRGNSVSGTVAFRESGTKLRIEATLAGLTPGPHGFHIHEKGDCSAADGMSAGGHFNPLGKVHAHPTSAERHAGDLPQLEAGPDGKAILTAEVDIIRIGTGATDIIGRSIVVHAGPDDYTTQPAGNSGPRVGCGVIVRG